MYDHKFKARSSQSSTLPFATSTPMRVGLPKQIQRALPFYVACLVLIFFLSYVDFSGTNDNAGALSKRDFQHQSVLQITNPGPKFPRKIWQMWKVDAFAFEERDLTRAKTWTQKNPAHRYEVLTDFNDMQYVEQFYGPSGFNRPDIVEMYRSLTAKIIKADLLRYLVMYAEGGVYADIDVEDLKPVDRWIPDRYNEADVDMVISVEIDQPEFADHPILGKKSQSFCQWTFMCKPRLPVMLRLVESILAWLNDMAAKQQVPISEITLDFDDVLSGTGPSAFTTAVLAEMSAKASSPVTWNTFHSMSESKLVGGFLVLTVEAFAAGQGHSDSGNHNARTALVKHHYHASGWPTNHPRYSHPVYGEVERCNWEPECVKNWDFNKAVFEALPPEEQVKQIWDKVAADSQVFPVPEVPMAFPPAAPPAAPLEGQPPVLDFPPAQPEA